MAIKKLIEVALPLEAINEASAREKSIRHGHPSTLHLWWARRPLAAARAVIWASLVDDPSSHPDIFPTEEDQNIERMRLFGILEGIVKWDNLNNDYLWSQAISEVKRYNTEPSIMLLDPFSGGGAIPLEAARIGLFARAQDLNPVAVMINKSMLEFPYLFSDKEPVNPESRTRLNGTWHGIEGMEEDIIYYAHKLLNDVEKKVGCLYPYIEIPKEHCGGEGKVLSWIWARTVKCPNPVCNKYLPLIRSSVLAKGTAYIDFEDGQFIVKKGAPVNEFKTVNRKGACCPFCGAAVPLEFIRKEGKMGKIGKKLIAIVAKGTKGRVYLSPNEQHEIIGNYIAKEIPDLGELEDYPGYLNPPAYGLKKIASLFTGRQITTINTFCKSLAELRNQIEIDALNSGYSNDNIGVSEHGVGAKAYAQVISVYLTFMIDKLIDYNSAICSWNPSREGLRNTFGLTGMSMTWDFAEANPFSGATGCFENMIDWVVKCIRFLPVKENCTSIMQDAQIDSGLRNLLVSTDPPYYSNIPYADFADFFYSWMRLCLKDVYPDLFSTKMTPKIDELVADPYRLGSKKKAASFFENGMLNVCKTIFKSASDSFPVTIYYAYKQSDTDVQNSIKTSSGWETMLSAIMKAGFQINGTWPIRTEKPGRSRGNNSNALASSIVLVCRKRSEDAPITTRRNMINTLRREMRTALQKLQTSNIAPVDMAQSAIGPGMAVFSRYSKVLEADGTPMSVRSALAIINEELDAYFNEQVGSMDSASRFCVDLYTQLGYNQIKYGEAEVLANAKGISIPALEKRGILYAKAGVLHLYERGELPTDVDAQESNIWLLTQQLTHIMSKDGIMGCAKAIVDMVGTNIENARDLAYRLYDLAEKKKWSEEAYAYNSLVVAWPDIQSAAAEMRRSRPQQQSLF